MEMQKLWQLNWRLEEKMNSCFFSSFLELKYKLGFSFQSNMSEFKICDSTFWGFFQSSDLFFGELFDTQQFPQDNYVQDNKVFF